MSLERWLEMAGAEPQGPFKNWAGTASSRRFVNGLSFFGDEPTPPLLAHFIIDFKHRPRLSFGDNFAYRESGAMG